VLLAEAAARTPPASPGPVDEHGLAHVDAVRSVAECRDGPGDLVAEGEGKLIGQGSCGPVHEVEVGVAESGTGDTQEHLARACHGLGDFPDLCRVFPRDELDGLHPHKASSRLN
jgi:hypothetical protein